MADAGPSTAAAELDTATRPNTASAILPTPPQTQSLSQFNRAVEIDAPGLTKQKRKRTSARDQQILETEFRRNPRPDKSERLDLVARVGLSDKEVQVWFQNRRQSNRRRSRPSDGSELMLLPSPQLHSDVLQSFFTASREASPEQTVNPDLQSSQNTSMQPPAGIRAAVDASTSAVKAEQNDSQLSLSQESAQDAAREALPASQTPVVDLASASQPSLAVPSLPRASSFASAERGYIADKRAMNRSISAGFAMAPMPDSQTMPAPQPRTDTRSLKRTSSYLRLSMTEDGHAKLIDRAIKSPSPKKFVDAEARSGSGNLRRSYSAAGFDAEKPKASVNELLSKKVPRTTAMGRSRDSRAWEFWCDSDARNSLVDKADQEINGSAADAISHIVASNKAMRAHGRRSLQTSSQSRVLGASRSSHRQPLARSRTSNGRLQSISRQLKIKTPQDPAKKHKGSNYEDIGQIITESDKENWTPTTEGGTPALSRHESYFSRPSGEPENQSPLRDAHSRPSTADSDRTNLLEDEEEARQKRGFEADDEELDGEVEHFMRGASKHSRSGSAQTSSGEELECVQSLLTLSQGNWR